MNYLAHIYLSGNDDNLKIGNFIADSIKGKNFLKFPEPIQKGVVLHRAIDQYTDTHPVVKKSVTRLFSRYSHYSRVIVDILYDHFLAVNWKNYSQTPLEEYTEEFYDLLRENKSDLPKAVQKFMPYMFRDNWLLSYASIDGITKILYQMNHRTKGKSNMDLAVEELEMFYDEFQDEFTEFFADLINFSSEKIKELNQAN
ncbi:acyl carrier protein phosphodiesterase [Salegentibacter sp. F188]|uniref:Acyl carrier protein phosphodiesterase n=1 Tax=Autumnicola patrickiae TaxID=3075591 RepID=A0ABU3E1E2_9FLAO|nr:acyl carrier protein phosphodiesterase [Salegentibacter sp. F188]MDT0689778.1 acyl carrier protein phosphodiesterase [Salegentibacter sp. F188]